MTKLIAVLVAGLAPVGAVKAADATEIKNGERIEGCF
jgi:hypothetical protein